MSLVTPQAFLMALSALGAVMGIGVAALGIGIRQGIAASKAVEGVARQPEAQSDILKTMLVGQAVAETTGIFTFIISLVLLFANPFLDKLI